MHEATSDDEGCEVLRKKKLFEMKSQLGDVEHSSEGDSILLLM